MVFGVLLLKRKLLKMVDDPLDVWTCHGMGGLFGALLTGLFAEKAFSGLSDGAFYGNGRQFGYQLAAVVSVIAYSCTATALIMILLRFTIGIKITKLENAIGMDGADILRDSAERQKEALVNTVLQRALVIFSGSREREMVVLTPDEEGVLHDVFRLFDDDNDGIITLNEFHKALSSMGLSRPKKDIIAIFTAHNGVQANDMDFEKFKKLFFHIHQQFRQESQQQPQQPMQPAEDVEMV